VGEKEAGVRRKTTVKGEKMGDEANILIVDDDESTCRTLSLIFRKKGYATETAGTGREALEKVQERFFNVALLDVRLPDVNGMELLSPLKALHPDIALILVTGHASVQNAVAALNDGATGYITKPLNMDEVLAKVRDILEKQRLVKEKRQAEELLEQRAAQLALLNDVGRQIAALLDLDSVLQRTVQLVKEGFGYHHAGLFILDSARAELVMHAKAGNFTHLFPPDHRLKLGQGMVGWAGLHGQTALSNAVDSEPRFVNLYPGIVPTAAELSVPLRIGEETIGVLDVQSPQPNAFGENDVLVMETLADQVAVAIENARLYEAVRRELAEREQAEEAVRQSEKKYRTLYETMRDAFVSTDMAGHILEFNTAYRDMLGYSEGELLKLTYQDITPSQWHALEARIVEEQILARGYSDVYEKEYRKKDGAVFPVELRTVLTRDEAGQPAGMWAIVRDITERRQAEEKIRRRNRELALLNQVIADSISIQEPQAILEAACRRLVTAFDIPWAVASLLNGENTEAATVAEYWAAGLEQAGLGQVISIKGALAFQHLLSSKGPLAISDVQDDSRLGSVRDFLRQRNLVSALLVPLVVEGRVLGSLCLGAAQLRRFSPDEISLAWSVADQAASALARAQMAQTQQRLITAIEQASESIVITDPQGIFLYVNPGFEQASGYSRDEVIGKDASCVVSGKHDAAFYDDMWATLRAGRVWRGRFINRKKDGSLYTEDATITPVRDENGAIVSHVCVQHDVTRELQLEEQYRQAQKMELVGRLTAGIAHDFNNLLTAINGFAELARSKSAPDNPLTESLDKILNSGWRAADLVRQLMAFSRKQVVEPEVLNLNTVVPDMDKLLRRVIGEHIELKTTLAPGLWPVKADPAQIEQVIVNLAVNARDAMPAGGHLTIETANVVLDQGYVAQHLDALPGEHVLLAVSDNGVGMSDEVKAHLFEPFFTTKAPSKGTGLGLATVYGIVKQSGGHIWCYSEEGRGTTFKIYLPRARGIEAPARRHDQGDTLPRGSETVLLVEDDPAVREMTARVLRGQGYGVLEAPNGAEALGLARKHPGAVHLLLTDVIMPGLSGKALVMQLSRICPGIKVLFMSGYTDDAIVQLGVLESGMAFLQKPFGPQALARKVRGLLDTN
jgi:PAS domain S-box-containing protein